MANYLKFARWKMEKGTSTDMNGSVCTNRRQDGIAGSHYQDKSHAKNRKHAYTAPKFEQLLVPARVQSITPCTWAIDR